MKRYARRLVVLMLAGGLTAVAAAACSSSEFRHTPSTTPQLVLALEVPDSTADSAGGGTLTINDALGNSLTLDTVELAVREIEWKPASATGCQDTDPATGNTNNDECLELLISPVIMTLPVGVQGGEAARMDARADSFDRVEFEIHKLDSQTQEDVGVLSTHPEFDGLSVRATGSYNGSSFVFEQDLTRGVELDLTSPVTIGSNEEAVFTVSGKVLDWFLDGNGNLIHPDSASVGTGNAVADTVRQNIVNGWGVSAVVQEKEGTQIDVVGPDLDEIFAGGG